jgi:ubiquinone/menaquinone biosynthesis C-methylase UbiE
MAGTEIANQGQREVLTEAGVPEQLSRPAHKYTQERQIIRAHWNSRAEVFDGVDDHGLTSEAQRQAWGQVLSPLAGSPPQRVLDVGCGTGFLAIIFASLGHAVTGVDFAPQMVVRARRKAIREGLDIDFQVGDAVTLDSDDQTFDVVVGRHVLWNLPEPERGVREWLRVLKPGGRLALVEGKWAESAPEPRRRFRAQLAAVVASTLAAVASRAGGRYPRWILDRKYNQIESDLPFFGGASADRLSAFLEAVGVQDVCVQPLMDPALWGEGPRYPRYLAVGIRPHEAL